MSTAIQSESQAALQPDAPTAPNAEPSSESRFVFYGITWKKYVEFLDWLDDRHHVVADAKRLRAGSRIRQAFLRGVPVGQHDRVHALRPQCIGRQRRD